MSYPPFVKIDSHAHLTSDELYPHVEEILERAYESGVRAIININTDQKTLERGLLLAEKHKGYVFNTAATTPHDVATLGELDFPIFKEAAESGKLVALGETGLDYYYEHSPRELQKTYCRKYFQLAHTLDLPVVIHCRNAFEDLFRIAREEKPINAVLHCFTGTVEEAREVILLGWKISCSGIVTYKKSEELREAFRTVPLDRLFLETDSPYLAPQKKRGKVNEPAYISETAEQVALLHEIAPEELSLQAAKNCCAFFRLSSSILN